MSVPNVPRLAESLLASLGADTEFRDAVLGDLAEEFQIREDWDGHAAATRWYYHESLRVAPHLLRNWVDNLRRSELVDLGRAVGVSSLAVIALETCLIFLVQAAWNVLGQGDSELRLWGAPFTILGWTLCDALFGGYIAARVSRAAPLPSAITLGLLWGFVIGLNNFALISATPGAVPMWFRVVNLLALVAGMIAGGALRVAMLNRSREKAAAPG
jgi:hypothetical protein